MIQGVDLWQGCEDVDLGEVYDSGRQFVLLRCRREWGQRDARYAEYYADATGANLAIGSWHFFNPYHDPERQLREALDYRADGDIPDAWDVERKGILTRSKLTDRTCWLLESLGQELGRRPLLYANYNYLENLFTDPGRIARAADLWLAWPSTAERCRTPKGYPPPLFWQIKWDGDVPGVNRPALETRFLGDDDAWWVYLYDIPSGKPFVDMSDREQDIIVQKALIQLGLLDENGYPLV